MKRGWFYNTVGWIADDIRRGIAVMKHRHSWIVLGMVVAFVIVLIMTFDLAIKTDTMLKSLHPGMALCRQMENSGVVFMFFGAVFFVLSALATIGEFFNYVEAKRRKAWRAMKGSFITLCIWGGVSLLLGLGMLFFLGARCA